MYFHSHFRSDDWKTKHQGDLHYVTEMLIVSFFLCFSSYFGNAQKRNTTSNIAISENYIQIVPLFYRPTIDFLCKQLQIMR